MDVLLFIIAFIIPIFLYNYFEIAQGAMALIWVIGTLAQANFTFLPAWIFGSLIAMSLKSKKTSVKLTKIHENIYHNGKHKIK